MISLNINICNSFYKFHALNKIIILSIYKCGIQDRRNLYPIIVKKIDLYI